MPWLFTHTWRLRNPCGKLAIAHAGWNGGGDVENEAALQAALLEKIDFSDSPSSDIDATAISSVAVLVGG